MLNWFYSIDLFKLKSPPTLNRTALFTLVLLGFAVRILISWFSIGTNDAETFLRFATYISNEGLLNVYTHFSLSDGYYGMNHPPLMGMWLFLAKFLADLSGWSFYFLFRLLPIAADAGTCYLLLKIFTRSDTKLKGWAVAASYSWCMAAILISGYHANTDSVYAFFCLLAAYFIQEKKAFFLAGLALACAINVKLIPVILIIPLFLLCRNRGDFLKAFVGLAIGALPFIICWIVIGNGFVSNIMSYNSIPGLWGVTLLFKIIGSQSLEETYPFYARYIILITAVVVSRYLRRRHIFNAYEFLAMSMAVFLLLTPGVGVQYFIGIIPLLFATNPKEGGIFGDVSGLFVFVSYAVTWTGTYPFYSDFSAVIPGNSMLIGIVVYFILLKFFILTLRKKESE